MVFSDLLRAAFVRERSFKFQVSGLTSEFQQSETNNLKLETCNLKRLARYASRFTGS